MFDQGGKLNNCMEFISWKEEKLSHKRTLCNVTEKENEENEEEKRENKLHNRRRQFPIAAPRH